MAIKIQQKKIKNEILHKFFWEDRLSEVYSIVYLSCNKVPCEIGVWVVTFYGISTTTKHRLFCMTWKRIIRFFCLRKKSDRNYDTRYL